MRRRGQQHGRGPCFLFLDGQRAPGICRGCRRNRRRSGRDLGPVRRRAEQRGSAAPGRGKIILNATLSIEALDFNATCTALARAAQSCGGYVSSTSIDTPAYEGAYRTAYYQFRIPAEQYSVFLEGAGSAGNLVSKQESTQDVTSAYVDVEARLKSLKLQEERLYAMMEQAGDLETLLAIQNQLTEVQYQIESYTAQQRTYDDLISYSTVDVTVEEVKQITEKTETFGDRVSDAFRRSWRDFGYGAQDFAVGFVAALPTLLVLAVLAAVAVTAARAAVRLHKKRLAGRPAPAPRTPADYAPQNGNEAETGKDAPPSTPPKYK
ncbi:MAG: DUF4349 domain-containing protein [Ruthenibacterium lactatiformans]